MRRSWVKAAAIAAMACAGPIAAAPPGAVAEVAAAISLAEAGVGSADAALVMTGLEVLSSHPTRGATVPGLRARYTTEAQFLLRGDATLARRLASVQDAAAPGRDQPEIWVFAFADRIPLPDGYRVQTLTTTHGAVLRAAGGARGQACTRRGTLWHCAPAPDQGALVLDGFASAPAWIVVEMLQAAP